MASPTWSSDGDYPHYAPITFWGWLRVLWRGGLIVLVLLVGIVALFLIRLVERPLCGLRRPVGGYVPPLVVRTAMRIMGLRYRAKGTIMRGRGAVVANHSSWLDIFTLNARNPVFFVAKSEVATWPGIGFLARLAGTLFIARDRKEAQAQTKLFEDSILAGQKLLFFPEGTSTDSLRVLPFKSTLFAAFMTDALRDTMRVQPVTVNYHAPTGADPRFYGWWGDMDFGGHMLQMLAARKHGSVEVVYHPAVPVAEFASRKALAAHAEAAVRGAHKGALPAAGR
ncbi:lysophospholipid acyltransferase family protein [Cognatishimia sp. SS12]|uniref:lysophospholipid acyltransferase family protein n=1 Tax=Cognatishimia sp. SS12 TaxID=2979465 RepID=UPI00232AE965|nr:lysophospholipid acyltransferase family protein [Cognatishimia sp. SS12]MDC0737192.1 lysophospholipid acyltransferase family protein [Cognatishimia sp. SS12]